MCSPSRSGYEPTQKKAKTFDLEHDFTDGVAHLPMQGREGMAPSDVAGAKSDIGSRPAGMDPELHSTSEPECEPIWSMEVCGYEPTSEDEPVPEIASPPWQTSPESTEMGYPDTQPGSPTEAGEGTGTKHRRRYYIDMREEVLHNADSEYFLKRQRMRRAANPEKYSERKRRYCAANREKINEQRRMRRAANREKIREARMQQQNSTDAVAARTAPLSHATPAPTSLVP